MKLYIARHGQTFDNAARILQQPNSPLSELGQTQARLLAERLREVPISHILCSDYLRTVQTAEPIANATGANLTLTPLLRERNFGELRGRSYDELELDPFSPSYEPPEGESWEHFFARVALAWQSVTEHANQTDGALLVMTHGFVCRALCQNHLNIPPTLASNADVQNTSLTIVEGRQPWQVSTLNCANHLIADVAASLSAPV
ncbi:histidine phosphatase family protein [Arenicella xantha]|uniref:Phosphoglycerate mutase n=1 Tax=Arenicella xantha TaxID=644221 RepID=A0A395JM52_9GAMM|nr:histidine phosphatase family protein [Arenicella xantha]RBP48860.1 phosphoglycerate mutase [Arenicella xantha]